MKKIKIALCQINPTVGDLAGNQEKIVGFYRRAMRMARPDLVVFPECALTGYPPEDLLLSESFVKENICHLKNMAKEFKEATVIVGFVYKANQKKYNSAAVIKNSKISAVYSKHILPNYGVFDEKRYFSYGTGVGIINVKGIPIGMSICEDIWEGDLTISPCMKQAKAGAKILVNISASPYYAGKFQNRLSLLRERVKQTHCPIVYVNMVGGQDELIFDGRSTVLDQKGKLAVLAKSFEEDLKFIEFTDENGTFSNGRLTGLPICQRRSHRKLGNFCQKENLLKGTEEIYQALVLGTRDYVEKNGFKSVVVGLSGGIDSSLVACIAVDALGRDRVIGVTMPSRYSSEGTRSDAFRLAQNLGIKFLNIPIERVFKSFLKTLSPFFKGTKAGIAEENLQSRIRGMLLMALSNKYGHLVLTTGNKSEVSVGYCTLYGDTAGGFAMLKDVPKTVVYKLSDWVNKKLGKEIIPQSVIARAPTAELKPNQKDQDSLPPYELLDKIIKGYVEEDLGYEDLLKRGFKGGILKKVIKMIDSNEYKRRQSPPGIKITPKSFGKDRRMPITNRYKEF